MSVLALPFTPPNTDTGKPVSRHPVVGAPKELSMNKKKESKSKAGEPPVAGLYETENPVSAIPVPDQSGEGIVTEIVIWNGSGERSVPFTCPMCGGHVLLEENADAVVDLTMTCVSVNDDGEVDATLTVDCQLVDFGDSHAVAYHCPGCGYYLSLTDQDGESCPVDCQEALAEWILKNCA
jgi:predicted RNA-binding Zn-ribbon protein involved in translation (DUF1610 family)